MLGPDLGGGVEPEFPGLRVVVGDLSPQPVASCGEGVDAAARRGGPGRDIGRPGFGGCGRVAFGDEPQGGAGCVDPGGADGGLGPVDDAGVLVDDRPA